MSSVSKTCPATVVQGDVGILAEEAGQRLLSIFTEAAMQCLISLRTMANQHAVIKFDKLFAAGIACIGTWNCDVIREEISKINAAYPETDDLYKYCYLNVLSALFPASNEYYVPPVDDFFHTFMKRLIETDDLKKGSFFFTLPYAQKRFLFVDCFRNALHDTIRRFTRNPETVGTYFSHRNKARSVMSEPQQAQSASGAGGTSALTKRSLQQQEQQYVSSKKSEKEKEAASSAGVPVKAVPVPPSQLAQSMAEMEEDEKSGQKRKTFNAAISDVAPPSSVQSASKKIPLRHEPCFYSVVSDTPQKLSAETFNSEQPSNASKVINGEGPEDRHKDIDAGSDSD